MPRWWNRETGTKKRETPGNTDQAVKDGDQKTAGRREMLKCRSGHQRCRGESTRARVLLSISQGNEGITGDSHVSGSGNQWGVWCRKKQ